MLRGADSGDAMECCRRRGAKGCGAIAARRAATAPTRQQTIRESSAPAVPPTTTPACEIPAIPVGTTPPMRQSPIRPIAVLMSTSRPGDLGNRGARRSLAGVRIEPQEMPTVVRDPLIGQKDVQCNLYPVILTLGVPFRTREPGDLR